MTRINHEGRNRRDLMKKAVDREYLEKYENSPEFTAFREIGVLRNKYPATCRLCSTEIVVGELIQYNGKAAHLDCYNSGVTPIEEKDVPIIEKKTVVLAAEFGGKVMNSKKEGTCYVCKEKINKRDKIFFNGRARHVACIPIQT